MSRTSAGGAPVGAPPRRRAEARHVLDLSVPRVSALDGTPQAVTCAGRDVATIMATDYGDPDLQVRIGHMYYMGNKDGIKNHVQARRYYQLAAAQGNAEAQATLGQMLSRGEGGPRDLVEARRMNTLAAAQGHAVAQTFLGIMYYQGDGGAQDFVEARRQLGLAAAQDHAEALAWLGTMHYRGEGGPNDYVEARRCC